MKTEKVQLKQSGDVVTARQACRDAARELGFGMADQTRLATAVSEMARNAIQYAGQGVCLISDQSNESEYVVRVVVQDHGPGIRNLDNAVGLGPNSSGSFEGGIQGAKRLVHDFEVKSKPGQTVVTLGLRRKRG